MSTQIPPSLQEDINMLNRFEAQLQNVLLAKQQYENQKAEIENAIKEIEKLPDGAVVYKIVGPVMISVKKEDALKELKSKLEDINLRLEVLTRQENMLRKKITELREKVMKVLREIQAGGGGVVTSSSGGGGAG